jgi:hypothetical protein
MELQTQPVLTFKASSSRAKTGVATVNLRCLPFVGVDGRMDVSRDVCGANAAAKVTASRV